ncbi:polysaccharide deacetylase family protein [Adhaeribacter sp. BT258]|uniref:Polysaccharide deacetylase family protein n=1 Tax=Adhaeribacter terrigena TaxID=2793070 RepID=A0ABS1BXN3_9BACT|nr:polysaccharide deacetylase family protein [Adhaeribacter terrigena]MBK0401906.1 polysaccharide deacetylase family protein [Adhaeribacter terrigena]
MMNFRFRHIFRSYFAPQAAVLMYHRVAEVKSDIWDITVSPENFERQLQLLQQSGRVISLTELTQNARKNRLKSGSIALTFDDGYADNFLIAKPLLEKYNLPATFFITTSNLGKKTEFWWDELESLILFSEKLPPVFSGKINGQVLNFELQQEAELRPVQRHINRNWKAGEENPPNIRCAMFLKLWQTLKPLPPKIQKQELQKIRDWAAITSAPRNGYESMSEKQLQELSRNSLFEIGAHTVSHAALAFHPPEFQEQELSENRNLLRDITNRNIELLSYPYGNYNTQTLRTANQTKFKAAFTTQDEFINNQTEQFRMGRFQVKDLPPEKFAAQYLPAQRWC